MKRVIETCADFATPINPPTSGLQTWLGEQAETYKLEILLAHALDGVIWGRWDGQRLLTAYEAADTANHEMARQVSAELRDETLQEARLFSPDRELHIWRSSDGWHGCCIREAQREETPTFTEYIDEQQLLWGDTAEQIDGAFTLMSDGAQGLRHAPPLALKPGRYANRPLRLQVRHYLADDEQGQTYVVVSRLIKVEQYVGI